MLPSLGLVILLACGGRVDTATIQQEQLPSIPLEELIPSLERAICDAGKECCQRATSPGTNDCRLAVKRVWEPLLAHAARTGATYDAEQAARCVEQTELEWRQCSDRKLHTSTVEGSCASIFRSHEPLRAPGQSCVFSMDCDSSATSPVLCVQTGDPSNSTKTCRTNLLSERDGPCGDAVGDSYARCNAPLVCGKDFRCHARPRLGESCVGFDIDACAAGYVCDLEFTGTCQTAIPYGESCSVDPRKCEHWNCPGSAARCRVSPDLMLDLFCP